MEEKFHLLARANHKEHRVFYGEFHIILRKNESVCKTMTISTSLIKITKWHSSNLSVIGHVPLIFSLFGLE